LSRRGYFSCAASGAVALVLLGFAACEGESLQMDQPRDLDAGTAAPGAWRLVGVLKDAEDRFLDNARVLACMSSVCLYGQTGMKGAFGFTIETPADLVIKTEPEPTATPRRAPAMVPVRAGSLKQVDVGDVYVPGLLEGQRLGPASADPQTLQVGDGLELTLHRGALKPPLGEALFDVAASRVPTAHVPRYPDLGDEEVVAVYALHPFAARSGTPIGVKAPSSLPAGTRVMFRTIDEIDGSFSEPVPGLASGEFVATDPAAGITELTHLVISH
jgi:hypothetical protein